MKKALLIVAMLIAELGFSQASQNINDYQYVIIPESFDFLSEPNQHNLNELTKMLFDKQGFITLYAKERFPDEVAINRCKALYADVVKEGGFLRTNLSIVLRDCQNHEVFKSRIGSSKEKEHKKAYYEALRGASESVKALEYKYSGNESATDVTSMSKTNSSTPAKAVEVVNQNMLFAQPIANGYQLVDASPKVVLKIYRTSQPDSFTAVSDTKNGVVFKRGNDWFFEYYKDDKLISEKLEIKF